ncbi:MAG: 30S ribosomal protein S16 [Pseudomonadota bacterium]|mgnify:CR=1 FL=1
MVTIRLSRGGANKRPFYHVVVADRRRAVKGQIIERVGYYNPLAGATEPKLLVQRDRIDYWLSKGAKATERLVDLLKRHPAA